MLKYKTQTKLNTLDFHSYDSLIANKNISDQLVNTYQAIFSDPLLWEENYSQQEVLTKLRHELSGNSGLRLYANPNKYKKSQSEVVGFCWAQQLDVYGVQHAIESIQYYQTIGSPKIDETLKQILNDQPVLYIHDLGITQAFRGQIPLHQLICPVINSLAQRSQTQRLFFWSIKESRIYKLAEYAGFKLVATVDGMQFFIGNIDNKRVRSACL